MIQSGNGHNANLSIGFYGIVQINALILILLLGRGGSKKLRRGREDCICYKILLLKIALGARRFSSPP